MKLLAASLSLMLLTQVAVGWIQQQEIPKGRIEGVILKTGSSDPIAGARVTLTRANAATGAAVVTGGITSTIVSSTGMPTLPTAISTPAAPARGAAPAPAPAPPPPPTIPSVTTDSQGKFVIPDLDAGSYRLLVLVNGYVRQEYGQRAFPGQGTILTLGAGRVLQDLTMRLTLTGNVSGRMRDSSGQSAVGVPLQLLKSSYSQTGEKIFQSAGSTKTNDRGEYRLYWVTPGRYYLAAGSTAGPRGGGPFGAGGGTVSPNDPADNYVFTFFPGSTDISAASSIEVTPGSEVNADYAVARQELYQIRGRVVESASGQPPASISVSLAYSSITGGGGVFGMNVPYTPTTGAFEIRDVVPGSYTLSVSSQGNVARIPLNVVKNIENLPVTLNGSFSFTGRISMDGPLDSAGVDRVRVQLRPVVDATAGGPAPSAVSADGSFKMDNVPPGEYRVGIGQNPGGEFYIKEARFNNSDALNQPLVLSDSVREGATLQIVISPNAGQLEGIVSDEKKEPIAGVQAVLIPDRYRDRPELFKAATTNQLGRFTIRGIPPGDYKLFSWESLESFGYYDVDLVKKSESQGKPVHVIESSSQKVDVIVIPGTP